MGQPDDLRRRRRRPEQHRLHRREAHQAEPVRPGQGRPDDLERGLDRHLRPGDGAGAPAVERAGGMVSLESVEDKSNAAGEVQKDGTFRIRNPLGQDGAPAGTYRVLVKPAEGRRDRPPIDWKYGRYDTSGVEVTV